MSREVDLLCPPYPASTASFFTAVVVACFPPAAATHREETTFLQIAESISMLGKNVKQELEGCLRLRNSCGHPNSLKIGVNKGLCPVKWLRFGSAILPPHAI
jgi:hypothetical protein